MNTLAKIAVIVAAIATVAVAPAQQRMMMGGAGMGSPSMLLFTGGMREINIRDDVSRELKLTNDQKDKLIDNAQKQREEMMSTFSAGGGERPDMDKLRKTFEEMQAKSEKVVKDTLTPEQSKRLKELFVQKSGNNSLMNAEIQKDLKFTEAQTTKVKELQKKQGEAMMAIFEKVRNGEIDRTETGPLMEKNTKILGEELQKVLTTEQAAQFKEMGGVKFKFDDEN